MDHNESASRNYLRRDDILSYARFELSRDLASSRPTLDAFATDHCGGSVKQDSARNVEREVSARFRLPAPTIFSQLGQEPAVVLSRLACNEFGHGSSKKAEPENSYTLHVLLRNTELYELQYSGQRVVRAPAARDTVFFASLRDQPIVNLDTPFDLVRICVTQAAMEDYARSLGKEGSVALHIGQQGAPDPVLSRLIGAVLPVFDHAFDRGQLFVDSIALAIQDHLLRAYGAGATTRTKTTGGLPPWLERRAKEFIESRLTLGVSLEEIARCCDLSPNHFLKAFRLSTGRPPHRWLLERRIEHAKCLLLDEKWALSEVARLCGFSDASHFSRTFSQHTRETPAAWRRRNRG